MARYAALDTIPYGSNQSNGFEYANLSYINRINRLFRQLRRAKADKPPSFFCHSCARAWPDFFLVSNIEWVRYVEEDKQDAVLCRKCYDERKARAAKGKLKKSYFKNFKRVQKRRDALCEWFDGPEGRKCDELKAQGKNKEAYILFMLGYTEASE